MIGGGAPLHLLLSCLLAASPGPADASDLDGSVQLTLADAVELALKRSPRLTELGALQVAADAAVELARSQRRPVVDVTAGYRRQSDVPELTLTLPGVGDRTIFPNIPDNYRSRLELRVPVYTSGRLEHGIDAALKDQVAATSDVAVGRSAVAYETRVAYWRLVLAREDQRVLGVAMQSFEGHLKAARDRQVVGMAAANEVLAVEVERDRAELAHMQSTGDVAINTAALARLLDLPNDARIAPSEPVAVVGCRDLAADGLIDKALAQRSERQAQTARLSAASARVAVAAAGKRPQAVVASGFDVGRPNSRILPPEATVKTSWDVGVSVSLPLFDGGRTKAAVAMAAAQETAVAARLDNLERGIALEVRQSQLELATAVAAIDVADRARHSAEENLRVARDRYQEGVLSSAELLDAETAVVRASLEQTATAIRAQIACSSLERAIGR